MLKLLGALLIFFCGAALAASLNAGARNALIQTEGFIELVRRLRSDIDCFSMPIPLAISRFPDTLFEKCGLQFEACDGVRAFDDLICNCDMAYEELRDIMDSFALHIGRGYKLEQLAICDRTVERLEAHRLHLANQLPAKQKTNGTLCLCGALAVVILIV